jgi:hypothetical protein
MARHVWSVLCDKDSVRESDQRLSLIDVVDHIDAFRLPSDDLIGSVAIGLTQPVRLVSAWTRTQRQTGEVAHELIRLVGPNGAALESWEWEIDLQKVPTIYTRREFKVLRYAGVGMYGYEVSLVDNENEIGPLANIAFELRLGPNPSEKRN